MKTKTVELTEDEIDAVTDALRNEISEEKYWKGFSTLNKSHNELISKLDAALYCLKPEYKPLSTGTEKEE